MTDHWQTLLTQQAALAFKAQPSASYVCPLPEWGTVTVEGEDAEAFLQNLLINDLNALADRHSQLSGFCTPKGRLLAIFWLVRQTSTLFELVMPTDQCSFITQRLTMFRLRSKVEITFDTDKKIAGIHRCSTSTGIAIDDHRALVIDQAASLDTTLRELLENGSALVAAKTWQHAEMNAGIAMVYASTREKFTAQQLNLDLINAVSFKKGCFPGQEVIARLHYLGEPKRRLFSAHCAQKSSATAGDEVLDNNGGVAGHIVQIIQLQPDQFLLQLSLKLAGAGSSVVMSDGHAITDVTPLVTA